MFRRVTKNKYKQKFLLFLYILVNRKDFFPQPQMSSRRWMDVIFVQHHDRAAKVDHASEKEHVAISMMTSLLLTRASQSVHIGVGQLQIMIVNPETCPPLSALPSTSVLKGPAEGRAPVDDHDGLLDLKNQT